MMLGEMDFIGTYVEPYSHHELPLPFPSFALLCEYFHRSKIIKCSPVYIFRTSTKTIGLFMILMPILLMNLLIGLAVGDIESVRRNAQLKRLAMQVVLHTELERKLPQMWLEKADKNELIEYPNSQKCKLGIFDTVLRKWFCNPFNDESKFFSNILQFSIEGSANNKIFSQTILTWASTQPKRLWPKNWKNNDENCVT